MAGAAVSEIRLDERVSAAAMQRALTAGSGGLFEHIIKTLADAARAQGFDIGDLEISLHGNHRRSDKCTAHCIGCIQDHGNGVLATALNVGEQRDDGVTRVTVSRTEPFWSLGPGARMLARGPSGPRGGELILLGVGADFIDIENQSPAFACADQVVLP